MEELRPRIKPKAPKALKQNVLKEVLPLTPIPSVRNRDRRWLSLSAAAVLFIGIMTFALWKGDTPSLPEMRKEATTELYAKAKDEASSHTSLVKETPESSLHIKKNKVVAQTRYASVSKEPVPQQSLELCEGKKEEKPTPDIASSTPPTPTEELGETERQLLADFEAHRDLVNACLAEELAQVRCAQQRIGQSTRQYLQQYRELQERITEQIREDIDNIAPKENHPKEV
jgi:hypothetical protein